MYRFSRIKLRRLGALTSALGWVGFSGCESAPTPQVEPAPRVEEPVASVPPPLDVFSADRAWADLQALEAIGPRVAGLPATGRAFAYLAERAEAAGLRWSALATTTASRVEHRHGVITLPGASSDLILLVAPFDSSRIPGIDFVGVNDGASGAALLLELARVFSQRALPYTIQLLFLEGEGQRGEAGDALRFSGSRAVAATMADAEELDRVRLLVAFNQVCDADLRIARDLDSHRMHREEFFRAARRVGRVDAFRIDQPFETVAASHSQFRARGVRPVVAIVDTVFGGDQAPGFYAGTSDDNTAHCAASSLETVGLVSLDAISAIGQRLAKIDRFSRAPLAAVEPEAKPSPGAPRPPESPNVELPSSTSVEPPSSSSE